MHPHPEHGVDGSDLWNLEKAVEELRHKVLLLEEKQQNATTVRAAPPSGVEAKLQVEVLRLKRGLEEHLRVFKSVFSNADVLIASDATLQLDKLWELVNNRDKKKEKKRGGGREGTGRGGNHRSRRETSGEGSFGHMYFLTKSLKLASFESCFWSHLIKHTFLIYVPT